MSIQFYEKVVILSSDRFPEYIGKVGVVLGISEDEDKVYFYSVFFPGEDEGISFFPSDVTGTGEVLSRSDFYDEDDRVTIVMDGDEGTLKE